MPVAGAVHAAPRTHRHLDARLAGGTGHAARVELQQEPHPRRKRGEGDGGHAGWALRVPRRGAAPPKSTLQRCESCESGQ